mgnify:CR=1 FL=1
MLGTQLFWGFVGRTVPLWHSGWIKTINHPIAHSYAHTAHSLTAYTWPHIKLLCPVVSIFSPLVSLTNSPNI